MTSAAPTGLGADFTALTRILLNVEAPHEQQLAARTALSPPPVPAARQEPTPTPAPVTHRRAAAAFTTLPTTAPAAASVPSPGLPAPVPEQAAPSQEPPAELVEPAEVPSAPTTYIDEREAARAVLEQLAFLDD